MNKKIQEQVLKSISHGIYERSYEEDLIIQAISRTQELTKENLRCFVCEKKLKLTDYKCCDDCALDYLKQQKAKFKDIIEELKWFIRDKIHNGHKQVGKSSVNCPVCLMLIDVEVEVNDLLSKLDNHSQSKNSTNVELPPKGLLISGKSKGCGKEYCASCKEVGKECDESLPCGTKMPLIIGEEENLWLCSNCEKLQGVKDEKENK